MDSTIFDGTLIDRAISGGNPDILKFLIEQGADLEGRYLMRVVKSHKGDNKLEMFQILLNAGVNPDEEDSPSTEIIIMELIDQLKYLDRGSDESFYFGERRSNSDELFYFGGKRSNIDDLQSAYCVCFGMIEMLLKVGTCKEPIFEMVSSERMEIVFKGWIYPKSYICNKLTGEKLKAIFTKVRNNN